MDKGDVVFSFWVARARGGKGANPAVREGSGAVCETPLADSVLSGGCFLGC